MKAFIKYIRSVFQPPKSPGVYRAPLPRDMNSLDLDHLLPPYNRNIDRIYFVKNFPYLTLTNRNTLWAKYRAKHQLDSKNNQKRRISRKREKKRVAKEKKKVTESAGLVKENSKGSKGYENIRRVGMDRSESGRFVKPVQTYGLKKPTLPSSRKLSRQEAQQRSDLLLKREFFPLTSNVDCDFTTKLRCVGGKMFHRATTATFSNIPDDVAPLRFINDVLPFKPTSFEKHPAKIPRNDPENEYLKHTYLLKCGFPPNVPQKDLDLMKVFMHKYRKVSKYTVSLKYFDSFKPIYVRLGSIDYDICDNGIGFDPASILRGVVERDIHTKRCIPPSSYTVLAAKYLYLDSDGCYVMFKNCVAYVAAVIFEQTCKDSYPRLQTCVFPLVFSAGKEGNENKRKAQIVQVLLRRFNGIMKVHESLGFSFDLQPKSILITSDKKSVAIENGKGSVFQGNLPSSVNNKTIDEFVTNFRSSDTIKLGYKEKCVALFVSFQDIYEKLSNPETIDSQVNDAVFIRYVRDVFDKNLSIFKRLVYSIGSKYDPATEKRFMCVFKLQRRSMSWKERGKLRLDNVGNKPFVFINQIPEAIIVRQNEETGVHTGYFHITSELKKDGALVYFLGEESIDSAIECAENKGQFEDVEDLVNKLRDYGQLVAPNSEGYIEVSIFNTNEDVQTFFSKKTSFYSIVTPKDIVELISPNGSPLHSSQHFIVMVLVEVLDAFERSRGKSGPRCNEIMEVILQSIRKKVSSMKCGDLKEFLMCYPMNEMGIGEVRTDNTTKSVVAVCQQLMKIITQRICTKSDVTKYGVMSGLSCALTGIMFYDRVTEILSNKVSKLKLKEDEEKKQKRLIGELLSSSSPLENDEKAKLSEAVIAIEKQEENLGDLCKLKGVFENSKKPTVSDMLLILSSKYQIRVCKSKKTDEEPYFFPTENSLYKIAVAQNGKIELFRLRISKETNDNDLEQWDKENEFSLKSHTKYLWVIDTEYNFRFCEWYIRIDEIVDVGGNQYKASRELKHADILHSGKFDGRGSACCGGELFAYSKCLIFSNKSGYSLNRKGCDINSRGFDMQNTLFPFLEFIGDSRRVFFLDVTLRENPSIAIDSDLEDLQDTIGTIVDNRNLVDLCLEKLDKMDDADDDDEQQIDSSFEALFNVLQDENSSRKLLDSLKLSSLQKSGLSSYASLYVDDIGANFFLDLKQLFKDRESGLESFLGLFYVSEERGEGFFSVLKRMMWGKLNGKTGFFNALIKYFFFPELDLVTLIQDFKRLMKGELFLNPCVHACLFIHPLWRYIFDQLILECPEVIMYMKGKGVVTFSIFGDTNRNSFDNSNSFDVCVCGIGVKFDQELSKTVIFDKDVHMKEIHGIAQTTDYKKSKCERKVVDSVMKFYITKKKSPTKKFSKPTKKKPSNCFKSNTKEEFVKRRRKGKNKRVVKKGGKVRKMLKVSKNKQKLVEKSAEEIEQFSMSPIKETSDYEVPKDPLDVEIFDISAFHVDYGTVVFLSDVDFIKFQKFIKGIMCVCGMLGLNSVNGIGRCVDCRKWFKDGNEDTCCGICLSVHEGRGAENGICRTKKARRKTKVKKRFQICKNCVVLEKCSGCKKFLKISTIDMCNVCLKIFCDDCIGTDDKCKTCGVKNSNIK